MHPALSIIFFTTASGAGFGLLFVLSLLVVVAPGVTGPRAMATGLCLGLALVSAGLLSSTLHLGHPERAWRAFSQWRTSWLSREGVLALLAYIPALALLRLSWQGHGGSLAAAVLAALTATLSAAAVFATSMIYASLKPIPAWHNRWVPAVYLALALLSGLLVTMALLAVAGRPSRIVATCACLVIVAAASMKRAYWRFVDAVPGPSTIGTATGLGSAGRISILQSAHTEENYLLKEMGFRIARKHARRLRAIAFGTAFVLPLPLSLLGLVTTGAATAAAATLGACLALAGVIVERWLFFAEAKHTMNLYYGDSSRPAAGATQPDPWQGVP